MAKRQRRRSPEQVGDYRHDEARRRNNPPAGIAPTYEVRDREVTPYAYDPHLDPQLQWAGKAEHTSFEVDVVSLHIHERISTRAILEAVKKPEPQLSLFGETPLPLHQQIEFYQHEVGWANRLVLGDSLLVMNSLLVKEGMAGKVQMIYVDPPYGIKYSSNFQPRTDRRDVKDRDDDLTHEPEQIKAYRDTWKLGIHSYLTYLRDRLLLARELLTESGSVFVQINDENLHLVRSLMDEVFGRENFVAVVAFRKTSYATTVFIPAVFDYLLWYAKDKLTVKYRQLYTEAAVKDFEYLESDDGLFSRLSTQDREHLSAISKQERLFRSYDLASPGVSAGTSVPYEFQGRIFRPSAGRHWKTSPDGLNRLATADRLAIFGKTLRQKRYYDDFPVSPISNIWDDTIGEAEKLYAVQTTPKVIERCILMTTDPGDLVFDPTCVREGTRVWTPLNPPVDGGIFTFSLAADEGISPSPSPLTGRVGVGLIPIESLCPGDFVLAHDGKPHKVLRTIRQPYQGTMVGIQHSASAQTLWVTADHRILCQKRTRSYGGDRTWRHVPKEHFQRARELRKEMTSAERRLWSALRGEQLGVKFRKQHPIGPYITDFYSWEAGLVVEVDGDSHFTPEAQDYDRERDVYLSSLGLTVLHFTNHEVSCQMEGVLESIADTLQQMEPSEDHYQEWRCAESLRSGDVVYFGPEQRPVEVTNLLYRQSEEDVYDLEVEGTHSFLTDVCAVHNCGSGTTAYCAEKWGRRWITCDTSRVALAIARQRLMTARFDYYELTDPERGPAGGFIYESVSHITLESIAKNIEIDDIAAKVQPQMHEALGELNKALGEDWKEWEVPREADMEWAAEAQQAHERFWTLKRQKRREIDESI